MITGKLRELAGSRAYILTGLLAALLVWLLTLAGALKAWDGFFYDLVFRLTGPLSSLDSEVVLVSINPQKGHLSAEEALRLVENLEVHKPRQVVLNFVPAGLAQADVDKLAAAGNVVIGVPLPAPSSPAGLPLSRSELIPPVVAGSPLTIGVSAVPLRGDTRIRELPASYSFKDRSVPALETAAAEAARSGPGILGRRSAYRVNYRGGSGSLPHLSLDRVLRQDLVSTLIEGRSVLVGRGSDGLMPACATPTTGSGPGMSFLEVQGHALNTLLLRKPIFVIPPLALLAILLGMTLLTPVFYQRLSMAMSSWVTLALLAVYWIAAFGLLVLARRWIPLGPLFLLQFGLFMISTRRRSVVSDQALHDLLFDLNAKLRERYYPANIYQEKEHWKQVIAMVVQTLSVKRLIFLERVPRDHRVREVDSYLCPLSDIDERRRDYLRTPYSDAIAHNGPIMISSSRPYLKREPGDDEQYLVPLGFAGNVLGFWAFSISKENRTAIPDFLSLVRDYAVTIGEMLYNRKELEQEEVRARKLWSVFTRAWEKEVYDALSETLELYKNQFDNLSHVFCNLNTLTIVYDLFGRVLEANDRMLEFLKGEGLAPYQMTLLDIFAALTNTTMEESRLALRQVIVERRKVTVVVNRQQKSFFVHLKPLEFKEGSRPPSEPAPFGVSGVVCEINEMTALTRLYEIKGQQVDQLNAGLQQDLARLTEALGGLDRGPGFQPGQIEQIKQAKSQLQDTIAALQWYRNIYESGQSPEELPARALPCNPEKPLMLAIDEMAGVIQKLRIQIDVHRPQILPDVLALPQALHFLFLHLLVVMVGDTREGGRLHVVVSESGELMIFDFSSAGYGMAKEKIERLLADDGKGATPEWRNLRKSLGAVDRWGGEWTADGGLGTGMRFTVRLMLSR